MNERCQCGRALEVFDGDLQPTCSECHSTPESCDCTRVGLQVVRLSQVEPEHIAWLWDGYLPLGKLVTLDGDPGVGKSTVTADLAARVSTGSLMPDGSEPVKGAVLILSAEDGIADTIRPRLDAAGADPERIITIPGIVTQQPGEAPFSRPVTIPGDLREIERVVTDNGVVLVIVDVLMAYLSAEVNSHRDQDVRRALHVLSAMADRTGCCVVVLRHLNKAPGGNALYRGGGSIGIIGAARAGFMCGTDPDDPSGQTRVFACVKSNLAAMPGAFAYRLVPDELRGCARIQWDGISERRAADLLADSADDDRTERDEAADWLLDYLKEHGGEAPRKEIFRDARAAGYKDATLKRAKTKAGVTHQSAGFPRQTVWSYPVGSPSADRPGDPPGEPTEPTGPDLQEHPASRSQLAQSAQPHMYEPTEPTAALGWPEGSLGAEANR